MAVTPVGNPYVESSDLVANYPGASEALAERIDIVGVNPFADAAARDTAIPSPVEGQMASLNDDDGVYRYDGAAWVAVSGPPVNGSDAIATSQSKSGGAYGDLATPGPIVTIVTGSRALVIVNSFMTNSIASGYMDVGVSVSGATTVAAVGMLGTRNPGTTAYQFRGAGSIMFTGLTAGTNVFKMQYSAGTGTATFASRSMTVIDMGS